MTYSRYNKFVDNGSFLIVPSIKIPVKSSDYYEIYRQGVSRLDNISYKYYGNPNYEWLIMMANPEYGSMEFDIPNGSYIRIPYPLNVTIDNYNKMIDNYRELYG